MGVNTFIFNLDIILIKKLLLFLFLFYLSSNTAECVGPEIIDPIKKCYFCGWYKIGINKLKKLMWGENIPPVNNLSIKKNVGVVTYDYSIVYPYNKVAENILCKLARLFYKVAKWKKIINNAKYDD